MTRYYLTKSTLMYTYRVRHEITEGCTIGHDLSRTQKIKLFEKEKDAFKELKGYRTEIMELPSPMGKFYSVTEYYIEAKEYDEDGNCVADGNILGSTDMIIEVNEVGTDKKIDEFDNFCDAEAACNDYDGDAYIVCL